MAPSLAVERLILNGNGINFDTKAGVSLKIRDEVSGIGLIVLRIEIVALSCANKFLGVFRQD